MRNFIISNFSHVRVKLEGILHEPRAAHRWQRATKWREGICSYTRTSFLPQKRTNTAQLLTESFRSKFRPKFSLPTLSSPESPPVFTWLDFPKENKKIISFYFPVPSLHPFLARFHKSWRALIFKMKERVCMTSCPAIGLRNNMDSDVTDVTTKPVDCLVNWHQWHSFYQIIFSSWTYTFSARGT